MSDCLESLFQGVNIIIEKRLEDVAFDSTLICTVVDDSRKKNGIYKVSDGNVVYTAYSESDKYSNKDQVRVSILNGDYSEKKFIVGKYDIDSDSAPITYVSPLDSVLNISGNLIGLKEPMGITANDKTEEKTILWSTSLQNKDYIQLQKNGIYDSIILKADFKTSLYNYDLISGSYGLRVDLLIKPHPDSQSYIRRWAELDSSEMFGNPYSFSIYSTQAKIIKLDTFGVIESVVLSLYQNNDFKNSDGEYIVKARANNILVRDIVLGFGSDLANKEDNLLELYTTSSTSYKYANYTNDTNKKTLGILWYNKDEHNQYVGFSDGLYDPSYDEITYLQNSRLDNRLTSRIGRENIPVDLQGLTLCANIEEAIPLINQACNLLDKDIYGLLQQFQNQFSSECPYYTSINTLLQGDSKKGVRDYSTILTETLEAIPKLENVYKKILAYDYHFQVNKYYNTETHPWPKDTTDYGNLISNNLHGLLNSIQTVLNEIKTGITDTDSKWSHYLSVWDTYNYRINKLIVNVQECLGEINTGYEKHFPTNVLNGKDYDSLKGFFESKTLRVPYTSLDLSPYNNKYCIYWYRYNKGYVQPSSEEGIMPNNWERIPELTNIGLPESGSISPIDGKVYYDKKPAPNCGLVSRDMQHDLQEEKYAVVLFYNHNRIQSKELVFTNEDTVPDKFSLDKKDILAFEHIKDSFDNYFLYSSTNYLVNSTEADWTRQIRCHYDGLLAKDEVMVSAGIYWYVPKNSTMLIVDKNALINTYGFVTDADAIAKPSYSRPGYECYYKKIEATKKDDGSWVYRKVAEGETEKDYEWDNRDFFYKIKEYYDHSASQNSIFCVVNPIGDPDPVEGEKFFSFGVKTTCGTKYTLAITNKSVSDSTTAKNLDLKVSLRDADNKTIPIYNESTPPKKGVSYGFNSYMLMYETDGDIVKNPSIGEVSEITVPKNTCGILKASTKVTLQGTNIHNPDADLLDDGTLVDKNDNNIVVKDEKSTRNVTLEVIKVIPWSNGQYYLRGPSQIIYNSMGTLDNTSMFDVSYGLFDKNTEKEITENLEWSIEYYNATGENLNENNDQIKQFYKKYLPILNSSGELVPAPLFVSGLEYFPVVIAKIKNNIVWKQPIIIVQNRYSSSLLNDWDGSFTIDEANGTIMAAMIGVGEKSDNNAFNGVLMGKVAKVAGVEAATGNPGDLNLGLSNQQGIGIYGFHDGAQSFCFNIDGTGFIGKAGGGRIIFNGDVGVIASADWFSSYESPTEKDANGDPLIIPGGEVLRGQGITQPSTRGMCIDLQNGHIDAYNFRLTSNSIYFNSCPSWSGPGDEPDDWVTNLYSNDCYYMKIGNETSFISLDSAGNLIMRPNNFYLAGQSFGSANLLHQTSPRYIALILQDFTYQRVINSSISYDQNGKEIISEITSGEVVIDDSYYDKDGNLKYDWNIEKWDVSPKTKLLIKNKQGGDVLIDSKTNEIKSNTNDITLYLSENNCSISQTVDDFIENTEYTLSGYFKSKDGAKFTIQFDGDFETKHATLDHVGDNNLVTFENNSVIISSEDNKYHYFTYTFKYNSGNNKIQFKCDNPCYLWHLKLEFGTIATAWCLSDQDIEENAYGMQNKYDNYLKQDKLFDKLFTDPKTGEMMDGIALQSENTPTGKPELYINATYIASGILRSKNWNGVLSAIRDTSTGKYVYDIKTTPTEGMYINLNEGKVWAAKFELNAFDRTKKGLYLNSHPQNETVADYQYFLKLGDLNDTYITYNKDGVLDLSVKQFILDAWDSNQGIYFNSDPKSGGYYFKVGDSTDQITFSQAGTLDIKASVFKLSAGSGSNTIAINSADSAHPLKIGSKFKVAWDGTVNASEAIISGNITATTLTATNSGTIGGWTISGNTLKGGSLTLNGSTGSITSSGSGAFSIDANGVLTATGATLTTLYVNGLKAGGDASGSIASLAVTGDSVAISTAGTLGPKISFTTEGDIAMQGGFTSYAGIHDLPGEDVGVVVNVDTGFNTYTAITIRKGVIVDLSPETGSPSWGDAVDELGSGVADNSEAIAETNKKVDDLTNAVNAINSVPSYSASQSGKVLKVNSSGALYWGTDNNTTYDLSSYATKSWANSTFCTPSGTAITNLKNEITNIKKRLSALEG